MTQVTTDMGLCPGFRLHGFSQCPPSDAKNCHALEMMHPWQWPGTKAPTKRHSSPVEAVLTGSRVAIPGLIEIFMSPAGVTALLTKANTIITVEGSRLLPRDALNASQHTYVRHQQHEGLW